MSVFNVIFSLIMMGIIIFSILLLVSSYYSKVNKGERVDFELDGVKDSGVVDHVRGDFIYVITESDPDGCVVITYGDIL